jgi:hypothetical protein
MISKHALQYFISRPLSLIIFNYQKSIFLLLFFLKRARPDSVDRAVDLGHFEFKLHKNPPLLRSYYKNENFFVGEWPILRAPASKEPSRDHQGQVSIIAACRSLTAVNKNPKVRLAAELALRCHRFQERFPGVPALAMSRKRAQSGHWLRLHQLLDGS